MKISLINIGKKILIVVYQKNVSQYLK